MSQNSTDMAGDYLQAVREAVLTGLNEADAPLPGFFRRRSKEAVYSQLAEAVVAELDPVVRMAVTEAADSASTASGDDAYEAGVAAGRRAAEREYVHQYRASEDRGAMHALQQVHDELSAMERTPQKALRVVEEQMRVCEERENRRANEIHTQPAPAVLDEEARSDG